MDADFSDYIKKSKGRNIIAVCYHFISECIDQLISLHAQKIAHCDIKPDNILLSSQGTIRIGDMGNAQKLNQEGFFDNYEIDTMAYLAPEYLAPESQQHQSIDIWALGICLDAMMSQQSSIILGRNPASLLDIFAVHQEFVDWYRRKEPSSSGSRNNEQDWESWQNESNEFSQHFHNMRNTELAQWEAIGVKEAKPMMTETILNMLNPVADNRPTAAQIKRCLQQAIFLQSEEIKQQAIQQIKLHITQRRERKKARKILGLHAQENVG